MELYGRFGTILRAESHSRILRLLADYKKDIKNKTF